MTKNLIDLQLIAQNLLSDNPQINNHFDKTNEPLLITGYKLSKKYPDLVPLNDNCLIKYIKSDSGIIFIIPFVAQQDKQVKIFDSNNKEINGYSIDSYKFTDSLKSVTINNGKNHLIISAMVSKEAKKLIANSDDLSIEGKQLTVNLLEEKLIFIPLRELPKSEYKLIKNHKRKTKKYGDSLIDIEDIATGEIFLYVAVNNEVDKLISKYGIETKFSITDHEYFTNKEDKIAVKTIIKDLNFKEDLSDIELF